jgi:phosphoserine phosphatase
MKYKLIAFDMDGVIFKDINFWIELHKKLGTYEEGVKLTKKYLHTNYDKLVEEVVVKLWKGKDAKPYFELVNSTEYIKGVKEVFRELHERGYITAIISAGSIDLARRVQKDFGVDHIYANELVIQNGKITGEFLWPIGAGGEKKARVIRDLCKAMNFSPKECIFISDNEADKEVFEEVGLPITFNIYSDKLEKIVKHNVSSEDLRDILKYIP